MKRTEGAVEDVTVIACDESASEGENLMRSRHPVFVHGSVNLTLDQARRFITLLRALTGPRAQEMKSTLVLAPKRRAGLLAALTGLDGHANIYFVDKSYFVTAKLIALLPGEFGERQGFDMHLSGIGREMANILHSRGPVAIGTIQWNALLETYNSVIRSYFRQGSNPPTVEPFFMALANARKTCRDPEVKSILDRVWTARHLTREYEQVNAVDLRELDPMFPSLATIAMTWRMRLGDVPFEILADNYAGLTDPVRSAIVASVREPVALRGVPLPRADLRGIRVTDSRLDERVQVADVLAGVGREVARLAMAGIFDDPLQNTVHQMLDFNVMSSGGSPLDTLVERAPLEYLQRWRTQSAL